MSSPLSRHITPCDVSLATRKSRNSVRYQKTTRLYRPWQTVWSYRIQKYNIPETIPVSEKTGHKL